MNIRAFVPGNKVGVGPAGHEYVVDAVIVHRDQRVEYVVARYVTGERETQTVPASDVWQSNCGPHKSQIGFQRPPAA